MNTSPRSTVLLPEPLRLEILAGPPLAAERTLAVSFTAVCSARMERAVERLVARTSTPVDPAREPVPLEIVCAKTAGPFPRLDDDESYSLAVEAERVVLTAPSEWGVLRGLVTLTQLRDGGDPAGPCRVTDAPRFPWRGLMLDVARHFIPHRHLLRTLDAMEVCKLNVLHLHLSDDQGFRFPSRRYPRLPSAEHYRADDLDALVTEAADRGIRVVPELDMPGHTASWLQAYPQWGSGQAEPSRRFGVHQECLDPTRPEVLHAVEALLGELAAVFPDDYLHIGGDEVHPAWWSEDDGVSAFMAREGLSSPADLQARFNRQVVEMLERLGRRPLGWDEVLHPTLPRHVTVQAWRGVTARDRILAAGHDCVLSAPYYLDLFFPADLHYRFDPVADQDQLLALEDALLDDPRLVHVAAGIAWTHQWRADKVAHVAAEGAGRLLGGEACLWSELVDARLLDVRLWSRLPALAERFWSPAAERDEDDLYRRLQRVLTCLPRWAGVDVFGDARRLAAEAQLAPSWQPLVELLEPVKWYGRLLGEEALQARLRGREMPKARPYQTDTPLDRVVDGLLPESFAARRLAAICRAEAGGDVQARAALREQARQWAGLPAAGSPAELMEAAARLRELGLLVEQVLESSADPGQTRERLAHFAQPMGEYLLAVAPVLQRWLEQRDAAEPRRV